MTQFLTMIGRASAAGLLALGACSCAAADDSPAGTQDDDAPVASTEQAVGTPAHCYAQIERPSPTALTLPIGTVLTLRTNPNLICPSGPVEKLIYRFYVEGPGGRISVQGATGWSTTRLVPFETTGLAAGRYKIYAYSLPASMKAAWLANDYEARHTSMRTGYTYFTLQPATSWSAGDWGTCSQFCDSGSQTRTVTCVDGGGETVADSSCSGTKPDESQACNTQACDPGNCGAAFGCHVSGAARHSLVVSVDARRSYQAEPSHAVFHMDSAAARAWLAPE